MSSAALLETGHELPNAWRFLLGDTCDRSDGIIVAWAASAGNGAKSSSFDVRFECACAHLYDSRLQRAKRLFQACCNQEQTDWQCLGEMGQGKVFNLLAQFGAADDCFRRALASAPSHSGSIDTLIRCFVLLNQSDWGQEPDAELFHAVESRPLAGQAEAVRRHTLARLLLRATRRFDALALVEEFRESEQARSLPVMYQAHLLRAHGILLSVTGRAAAGREAFRMALESFESIGYLRGVVRTLLSLVRNYSSLDLVQAQVYLNQAKKILQDTATPGATRSDKREMPMEWGDFYGRAGDIAYLRGDFRAAEQHFRRDVEIMESLQIGSPESLRRESGHAYRNLGKALLQNGAAKEAVRVLGRSARLFEATGDDYHAFNSGVAQCEAAMKAKDFQDAASTLKRLGRGLFDTAGRNKERAIVQTLKGALAWSAKGNKAQALQQTEEAIHELKRIGNDYHYCRALLARARIMVDTHDAREARALLLEAWRCSASAEMADIRVEAEMALEELGIRRPEIIRLDKTDLERECESKGYTSETLTILYADIRGFTEATTTTEPGQMAEFIGEFSKIVSACAARKGGLPIRFLGDCVMALFGVRNDASDMVVRALEAACEMHELFVCLRQRWGLQAKAFEKIGLGCGIATGKVVAGKFGAAGLSEFSVIGEPANLASRIQQVSEDGQICLCPNSRLTIFNTLPGLQACDEHEQELKGLGKRIVSVLNVAETRRHLRPTIPRPPSASRTDAAPETVRERAAPPTRPVDPELGRNPVVPIRTAARHRDVAPPDDDG